MNCLNYKTNNNHVLGSTPFNLIWTPTGYTDNSNVWIWKPNRFRTQYQHLTDVWIYYIFPLNILLVLSMNYLLILLMSEIKLKITWTTVFSVAMNSFKFGKCIKLNSSKIRQFTFWYNLLSIMEPFGLDVISRISLFLDGWWRNIRLVNFSAITCFTNRHGLK